MITRLDGFPDDVIAMSCSGQVSGPDYETVLMPAVADALTRHLKLRLYYETDGDFEGLQPAALWDDFKLGLGSLTRWERVAVVTDVEWIRLAVQAFAFLMPGDVRVFPLASQAKAQSWIAEASSAAGPAEGKTATLDQGPNETVLDTLVMEELDHRRDPIAADMKRVFEKYRAIFDWETPEIDQPVADALILAEMRKALDRLDGKGGESAAARSGREVAP